MCSSTEYANRGGVLIGRQQYLGADAIADEVTPIIDDFVDLYDTNRTPAATRTCVLMIGFVGQVRNLLVDINTRLTDAYPAVDFQYYGPDALKDGGFAAATGAFPILVTAPTNAQNEGFTEFRKALRARFEVEEPPNFTFNMYDAVILLGLAMTSARSTDAPAVRDALFEVSRTGDIYEGEFFGDIANALLANEDVDYVGPSGNLDFDENGDVLGDYALHLARQVDQDNFDFGKVGSLELTTFAP